MPGLCEELFFRGLLFRLARRVPQWMAIAGGATAFSLWHLSTPIYLPHTFLLGLVLGIAAMMALLLGVFGIYGVISYAVSQRRREIGIRMALGADRGSVVRLMIRESAGYAAAGLAAGTTLALAASRFMQGLLFEVPATDVPTYVSLALGVALLVVVASYAPARRAASIAPSEALRGER